MMKMIETEDLNLILTVKMIEWVATNMLKLLHNSDHYVLSEKLDIQSWKITLLSEKDNDAVWTQKVHWFCLFFDKSSKNIEQEFFFSTEQICDDLLILTKYWYNISEMHFYITFDKKDHLLLIDKSTREIFISYNSWRKKHK